MVYKYTDEEGIYAVRLARTAVKDYFRNKKTSPENVPEKFLRESGVFTTINSFPGKELRGCIGFPEPIMPLYEAIIKSAVYAATEDPRFPPVEEDELDKVVFEVSLLTIPERILVEDPEEYPERVEIGKDGLIIRYMGFSGLLLPQVATEYSMDSLEFLDHTCLKAGLSPGCWRRKGVEIYKFQAEIFTELEPEGKIERMEPG
ncbi:MAG: TIGR00296 family protein [Thermoplasmata archaeon]